MALLSGSFSSCSTCFPAAGSALQTGVPHTMLRTNKRDVKIRISGIFFNASTRVGEAIFSRAPASRRADAHVCALTSVVVIDAVIRDASQRKQFRAEPRASALPSEH